MNTAILRPVRLVARLQSIALLTLGLLLATACGPGDRETDDAAAESWPLLVDAPGVLGYLSVQLPPEACGVVWQRLFGAPIDGVDLSRPACLVGLDEESFGGPVELLLPVSDADALRAALNSSPYVESMSGRELKLRLPADHELAVFIRAVRVGAGFLSGRMGGADIARLAATFQDKSDIRLNLQLEIDGAHATLAPSFEGLLVARRLREEIGGLELRDRYGVHLAVDVDRFEHVYYEDIKRVENTLRAALTGARGAGLAGMIAQMASGRSSRADDANGAGDREVVATGGPWGELFAGVPTGPETWAVIEMLGFQHVFAVGLSLEVDRATLDELAAEGEGLEDVVAREFGRLAQPTLRLDYNRDSPQFALLEALRPVPRPALDGADALAAALTLRADPTLFATALSEWIRPLAVALLGDGSRSSAWQAELRELLRFWDGRMALSSSSDGMLLLGLRGDAAWDQERLVAWVEPLLPLFDAGVSSTDVEQALGALHVEQVGEVLMLARERPAASAMERATVGFRAADWFADEAGARGAWLRGSWASDENEVGGVFSLELTPTPFGLELTLRPSE